MEENSRRTFVQGFGLLMHLHFYSTKRNLLERISVRVFAFLVNVLLCTMIACNQPNQRTPNR